MKRALRQTAASGLGKGEGWTDACVKASWGPHACVRHSCVGWWG